MFQKEFLLYLCGLVIIVYLHLYFMYVNILQVVCTYPCLRLHCIAFNLSAFLDFGCTWSFEALGLHTYVLMRFCFVVAAALFDLVYMCMHLCICVFVGCLHMLLVHCLAKSDLISCEVATDLSPSCCFISLHHWVALAAHLTCAFPSCVLRTVWPPNCICVD